MEDEALQALAYQWELEHRRYLEEDNNNEPDLNEWRNYQNV